MAAAGDVHPWRVNVNIHLASVGYVGTWNVYSYVRTSNTTNATLNIRDFTNDVVSRGWMSSSKYLTSVQAGPEIFTGSGEVTTGSYSVTIN